jgi:hypothetical protein
MPFVEYISPAKRNGIMRKLRADGHWSGRIEGLDVTIDWSSGSYRWRLSRSEVVKHKKHVIDLAAGDSEQAFHALEDVQHMITNYLTRA